MSNPGDVVIEPFAGSGDGDSVRADAQKCCAMELDPKYCDVIRRQVGRIHSWRGMRLEGLTPEITNDKDDDNA